MVKYLDHKKLLDITLGTLAEGGVSQASRECVAESLVQASLRGIDSHGIHLLPLYLNEIRNKRVNPDPHILWDRKASNAVLLDADDAFGHYAGSLAVNKAVELALSSGIAIAGVASSTHFGAAFYFSCQAAEKNCIGLTFSNTEALMKTHGGIKAFCGTNPICFAAPMANEAPFCLDMATTHVTWNRIVNCRKNREPLEKHWAFDSKGHPVTDAAEASSLRPIGDYKGFGLALMIEIICGILLGGRLSADIPALHENTNSKRKVGHVFIAINIGAFVNVDEFKQNMSMMAGRIRSMVADGTQDSVMISGDPEKRELAERSKAGIPINEYHFNELLKISARFNDATR